MVTDQSNNRLLPSVRRRPHQHAPDVRSHLGRVPHGRSRGINLLIEFAETDVHVPESTPALVLVTFVVTALTFVTFSNGRISGLVVQIFQYEEIHCKGSRV